ncbi:hypothetical protein SRHO_G00070600 [Serrasalmus rhombeus]
MRSLSSSRSLKVACCVSTGTDGHQSLHLHKCVRGRESHLHLQGAHEWAGAVGQGECVHVGDLESSTGSTHGAWEDDNSTSKPGISGGTLPIRISDL